MLRILTIALVLTSLVVSPLPAQETASRAKSAAARRSTPMPVATPIPERRPSFFERLFGRRKPKPTPAPTPAPTPKPRPKPRPIARPTAKTTGAKPRPGATAGKPTPTQNPDATTTPDSATPKPAPTSTTPRPVAKKTAPRSTGTTKPAPPPPDGADAEQVEKHKYDTARAKAAEDPAIQALKEKADNAVSDDEAKKAQTAYNRALFDKMRKLDPSIKDRIDKMEAALMKRLGSQPGR
jgi:hypothetical protein